MTLKQEAEEIVTLKALLRLMVHYDGHTAFCHDYIRDEKKCNHCKILKRVHKVLWG